MSGHYLPREAEIVSRTAESADTFSLQLRLTDGRPYDFAPGQFNMLYLYGCGEVPISIVSDDPERHLLMHTIRAVGRITHGIEQLQPGDHIGLRGPYGRGWPMDLAEDHDIVIVTGGLGCAPSVSIIHHVLTHRQRYGHLHILQGVKHADDMIWRSQYAAWAAQPDIDVLLAADVAEPGWHGHVGLVTALFEKLDIIPPRTIAMLCGPEVMMRAAASGLHGMGIAAADIYLSMERNMHCGIGQCGHCQFGGAFVCRDGPVFPWPDVRPVLGTRGF
jgi:NAD(P)H-flavin reductase